MYDELRTHVKIKIASNGYDIFCLGTSSYEGHRSYNKPRQKQDKERVTLRLHTECSELAIQINSVISPLLG